MRQIIATALLLLLISCSSRKPAETGAGSTATAGTSAAPATYTPRIGIAVTTSGRTCLAIHNANVAPSTPVTLVSPMPPQTFIQAEVAGPSQSACPISKDVDPTVSNYEIHLSQGSVQKLTPLIAVLGASAPFSMAPNNSVQADLDQNGKIETFRCVQWQRWHPLDSVVREPARRNIIVARILLRTQQSRSGAELHGQGNGRSLGAYVDSHFVGAYIQ